MLVEVCGDVELEELDLECLDRWRARFGDDWSPYTVAGHLQACRTFCRWCVKRRYLSRNVAGDLDEVRLPAREPANISEDDLEALLGACENQRDYVLLLVLASSGCRVGGLVGLTWSDVDLEAGVLQVVEKFDALNTYYLVDVVVDELREWRDASESEYVFPSLVSGQPLTRSGIYQVLKRLAETADIEGPWNPHAFRHRKARRLIENGADLETVSELLNHSDIAVTAQFYVRWSRREVQQRHGKFSRQEFPGMQRERDS
jgi:integrase/recombinase XerD